MALPYQERPLLERLKFALSLGEWVSSETFLLALGVRCLHEIAPPLQNHELNQVLHFAAAALSRLSSPTISLDMEARKWRFLFQDVLRLGASLHASVSMPYFCLLSRGASRCLTPMMRYLLEEAWISHEFNSTGASDACIRHWAEELQLAGVDLMNFGRNEDKHWGELPTRAEARIMVHLGPTRHKYLRMNSFSYGPQPTVWSLQTQKLVKTWKRKTSTTPGAWELERSTDDDQCCLDPEWESDGYRSDGSSESSESTEESEADPDDAFESMASSIR